MTLLLAFFIILQAFATEQEAGLFYSGQGSFVRALETFGLGGVWDRMGGGLIPGRTGPAYPSAEGAAVPPEQRRIDPELEEARRALAALQEQFPTDRVDEGSGWRVSLPMPFREESFTEGFSAEERAFCSMLARRVETLILTRGFVVRIGAELADGGQVGPRQMQSALARSESVRQLMLQSMRPQVQQAAAGRLYTFCRRQPGTDAAASAEPKVRLDILLTKPYADAIGQEELGRHEDHEGT